jgi:DNA repair protein RadC
MATIKPNRIRIVSSRRLPRRTSFVIDSPTAAATAARHTDVFEDDGRERFAALLLDAGSRLLGFHLVSLGSVDGTQVHPKEVFGPALRLLGCCRIVLVHNHPSGDHRASLPDIALTRALLRAGRLLRVDILDHIILGDGNRWSSMNQDGLCTFDGRSEQKTVTTPPRR